MEINTETLLEDLINRTRKNMNAVEGIKEYDLRQLNRKPSESAWSALECIEHLKRFGDFYVPEIDEAIRESDYKPDDNFKGGWFGNYFAEKMKPGEQMTKFKTFKNKDPSDSQLDKTTIDRFLDQQERLLDLLDRSRQINLNKTRVPISITRLIRLKLGDILRVVIFHNERHVQQAKRAITAVSSHKRR